MRDGTYHRAFEVIYSTVRTDKEGYLRALRSDRNTAAATTRLSNHATALRLLVESGYSRIKFKTAISLLDHIVEILPTSADEVCEPLRNNYVRILRTILEQAPLAEHLKPKQWTAYLDFTLAIISISLGDDLSTNSFASNRELGTSRNTNPLSILVSQSISSRRVPSTSHAVVEDLLAITRALTAITNAPVAGRAQETLDTILDCLHSTTKGQELALETFSNVAFVLLGYNVRLLRDNFKALVPIVRRLWSIKSPTLREQILVVLDLCQAIILAKPTSPIALDFDTSTDLLQTLQAEYHSRPVKDLLTSEDMVLQLMNNDDGAVEHVFQPQITSDNAVAQWTLVRTIARLHCAIHAHPEDTSEQSGAVEHASKRRRTSTPLEDLWHQGLHSSGSPQVAALQVTYFVMDELSLPQLSKLMSQHVGKLSMNLSTDDSLSTYWTFLVLSKFVQFNLSTNDDLSYLWVRVLDAAFRATAVPNLSRAACLTVASFIQSNRQLVSSTSTSIQVSLFVSGKSGPANMSDAALWMFTAILQSGLFQRDETFETFSNKVLSWLRGCWTLPSLVDRAHNAHLAAHARSELLCMLLAALKGVGLRLQYTPRCSRLATLYQWTERSCDAQPLAYLLAGLAELRTPGPYWATSIQAVHLNGRTRGRMEFAVSDLLQGKLRNFADAWTVLNSASRASGISHDVLNIVTSLCVVSYANTGRPTQDSAPSSATQELSSEMWQTILAFIAGKGPEIVQRASSVAAVVTRVSDATDVDEYFFARELLPCTRGVLRVLKDISAASNGHTDDDDDLMDSLDTGKSYASQGSRDSGPEDIVRYETTRPVSSAESLASNIMNLAVMVQQGLSEGYVSTELSQSVLDEILLFDAAALISSRHAIRRFLQLQPSLSREQVLKLLEALGTVCLADNDFERCEAAQSFCATSMMHLTHHWTGGGDDDLADRAYELYEWFVETGLGKGVASSMTLLHLAHLLDAIASDSPAYAEEDMPSTRTSLLRILNTTSSSTRLRMASDLNRILGRFVLSEHGAIFDDILDSLPSDADDVEGLGTRFYVLAQLGSVWHSVLRNATYSLFETAAHATSLIDLQTSCIAQMSTTLKLSSPNRLFDIFSSQIFYTWLGLGTLAQIPHRVFSYASIQDLLRANEAEVVAQIALRASHQHMDDVSRILRQPWKVLLQRHFARADAYCLASQMSLQAKDQLSQNPEAHIRKELGSIQYQTSLQDALPDIIATFIESLQDDSGIERGLEKAGMTSILKAFKAMSTGEDLAGLQLSSQQPVFKSKQLVAQIRWLCDRLQVNNDELWSSALLVRLYRSLLRAAEPALGALHATGILRKIRIVIAMGGRSAIRGYPLEMLLHSLRSYLTLFQSSGDAIKIYRYLLENGQRHLQTRLSFLSGIGVSVFASLTAFVLSSQDSTTQESHFHSTMTKAQEFRQWLSSYLGQLSPASDDSTKFERFKSIISRAAAMTGDGTSSRSSNQGSVLLSLLEDQVSNDPLLHFLDFEQSILILCKRFQPARQLSDDILGLSIDAARMMPILERILKLPTLNPELRTWVAHTIGRGISRQGPFHGKSVVEGPGSAESEKPGTTEGTSHRNIMANWQKLLWRRSGKAPAFAEECLQAVACLLDQAQVAELFGSPNPFPILDELRFVTMTCSPLRRPVQDINPLPSLETWSTQSHDNWPNDLLISICAKALHDPILHTLQQFAFREPEAAHNQLPYAIHLVLMTELDGQRETREVLSSIFGDVLEHFDRHTRDSIRHVLNTIIYLRKCAIPHETSIAQRAAWLDVDYLAASKAAVHCEMWHTSLLLLELQQAEAHLAATRSTRRSNQAAVQLPDFLTDIYQHVDDPDFFYAGHVDVDVASVVHRLNHESAGYKLLSFQSALYDSCSRSQAPEIDLAGVTIATAKALSSANLKGISQVVRDGANDSVMSTSRAGDISRNLLDWDLIGHEGSKAVSTALQHLQALTSAVDTHTLIATLDTGLAKIAMEFPVSRLQKRRQDTLTGLAVLAEAKDVLRAAAEVDYDAFLESLTHIDHWGAKEDFEVVSYFLDTREYICGCISRSPQLRGAIGLTAPLALLGEARVVRQSLLLAQQHESRQFSLSRAAYFSSLAKSGEALGVKFGVASQYDLARTLWSHDEGAAAVKILQNLRHRPDLGQQDIPVSLSEILADLGQQVTEARLEPAHEVIKNYLEPAYRELGPNSTNAKAGQIFHIFAAFCDSQLQDQESRDEYVRMQDIKETKEGELAALRRLEASNPKTYERARKQAEAWLNLDQAEWNRIQDNRQSLVLRCLEHYLLSMKACDTYSNDTLRVLSIWLEEVDNPKATDTVNKHIKSVPSWKFARLISQLLSRLQNTQDGFQQCLADLVFRICSDHPYHGLYQLFAASKTRSNKADPVGTSRYEAVGKLAKLVLHKSRVKDMYTVIHNLNVAFVNVAHTKLSDKQERAGNKLLLRDVKGGSDLINGVEYGSIRVPAPSMQIALQHDRNYKSVHTMTRFDPKISIAGGISAPKIATVIISDGSRHKMLLKGGNDDLRQDSIMEQVFEQVSDLLKEHRTTRERKLNIRTYKVVPLLANAGIIEFVQGTMSLQDYLFPAHSKYFPKDFSKNRARTVISDASGKSASAKLAAYQQVVANFHPVMRFFFMEYFPDPDEWFYKRLSYTRSVAAMSMLGHVLGVGDRHTQNILLDSISGEVVHIDLGIAFESGRVLPIPETVPFRLTRDMVDGMGISGVEGVFRRCCNFTLDALRLEQESIMTILDVLRYDPLYSWSVSPLRLAKMQENANRAAAAVQSDSVATSAAGGATTSAAAGLAMAAEAGGAARRGEGSESAEASRALAVVLKKLGKGLSVEATVNELIRQATDERNLSMLFSGWAAYA